MSSQGAPSPTPSLNLRIVKQARPGGGVALFALIRDEDYFLPFFFDHYRSLGIETFLIYDDRSGEATKAFLHAQNDCSILASDHVFADVFGPGRHGPRRLGAVLKEAVPGWAFPDRWALAVDADEYLVLPTGFDDLGQMIERLEAIGQPYLTAPVVDFYGETLNHRTYPAHVSPFEATPYFDVGPYYKWAGGTSPISFPRGVRTRLAMWLADRQPELFASIYGNRIAELMPWKVPLLKNGAGIHRDGNHELDISPASEVTGALAHFKFYPGLDAKIAVALAEQQYARESRHYRFLAAAIEHLGDEPLVGPETRRYSGPASLEAAGLLRG
jgi:hypothetical protein